MSTDHTHRPIAYPACLRPKLDEFKAAAEALQALSIELTPGRHSDPTVVAWAVGIDRTKTIVAAVLDQPAPGLPGRIAVHQGDRYTAANWLRTQGVPIVRIGFRSPTYFSPVRFNPTYFGEGNE